MKVYELMNVLDKLPSGAEVVCFTELTVNELKSGLVIDRSDKNNIVYEVRKPLDSVEKCVNSVYLDF